MPKTFHDGTPEGDDTVTIHSHVQDGAPYVAVVSNRYPLLSPDDAEAAAMALLHSAAIARFSAGTGPRPTDGAAGRTALALRAERLALHRWPWQGGVDRPAAG